MSELYSYPSNDYRSYLAHHGVKGMRWGYRKNLRESNRKQKYRNKFGITSKQYDSVRKKSLERHETENKYFKLALGSAAALTALHAYDKYKYLRNTGAVVGDITPKEAAKAAAAAGIVTFSTIGTVGAIALKLGRDYVDTITESMEYSTMNTKELQNNPRRNK